MSNPTQTVSTVQILNLIHKATTRLRDKDDPNLALMTDTAVSILSLHLRKPYVFLRVEQVKAIEALKEYLE